MNVAADPSAAEQAAERSRRLDLRVERDLARRRRLVRIYLLLVAVPLVVAAAFLLWGRTDREMVQEAVASVDDRAKKAIEDRVEPVERRYQEIAPQLDDVAEVSRLLPELRAVEDYSRTQADLRQRLEAVSLEVERIVPTVEAARAATEEIEVLREQQIEVTRRFDALDLQGAPPAAGETHQPAASLTPQQQAVLKREVRQLMAAAPPPSNPDLEELSRRVEELQSTVARLERQIREIRSELGQY